MLKALALRGKRFLSWGAWDTLVIPSGLNQRMQVILVLFGLLLVLVLHQKPQTSQENMRMSTWKQGPLDHRFEKCSLSFLGRERNSRTLLSSTH